MAIPQDANQRWSLDFVSDALACSRRFCILTIVDDFSRECLALVIDNSLSGVRMARELYRIIEIRGRPCMIVSDNVLCSERKWATRQQVSNRESDLALIPRQYTTQVASTEHGMVLCHSKHRVQA